MWVRVRFGERVLEKYRRKRQLADALLYCTPGSARGAGGNSCSYRDNFLRPTSTINQSVSLARRQVIHVQRVAALRDLISVA
jgi:hypothetical protein